MKIMPCPLNGPRNIQEFICAGPVEPHPDPNRCSDHEWAEFVWLEENLAGVVREWWCHAATSYWFIAERNTVTDEILATYPADRVFLRARRLRPARAARASRAAARASRIARAAAGARGARSRSRPTSLPRPKSAAETPADDAPSADAPADDTPADAPADDAPPPAPKETGG